MQIIFIVIILLSGYNNILVPKYREGNKYIKNKCEEIKKVKAYSTQSEWCEFKNDDDGDSVASAAPAATTPAAGAAAGPKVCTEGKISWCHGRGDKPWDCHPLCSVAESKNDNFSGNCIKYDAGDAGIKKLHFYIRGVSYAEPIVEDVDEKGECKPLNVEASGVGS